jgi:hypothetical protein
MLSRRRITAEFSASTGVISASRLRISYRGCVSRKRAARTHASVQDFAVREYATGNLLASKHPDADTMDVDVFCRKEPVPPISPIDPPAIPEKVP